MKTVGRVPSQALADLLWVLGTPALASGANVAAPVQLDAGTVNVANLEAFISKRPNRKVGRYFETLILYWLTHIVKVELIANGLQIMEGKRTVGELDFLFRDTDGVLNHWETAVKFFLHYPRQGESHFPGPNPRDNFERKMAQLFDKQLRLGALHYPDVQIRKAFVRGLIFNRWNQAEPIDLPTRMNADCLKGKWLRRSELSKFQEVYDSGLGHIVAKPFWFAPVFEPQLLSVERLCIALNSHFQEADQPRMISMRDADGSEVQRAFVVSDNWPTADESR